MMTNSNLKPKLSRHIKLNHTNIALLLQEATQKYKQILSKILLSLSFSLCFSLFTATCVSFAFFSGRVFVILGHSTLQNYIKSWMSQVIIHAAYSFFFLFENSPAKCHCLNFNLHYFMSSITTEHLQIFLFHKFFCTNLFQVELEILKNCSTIFKSSHRRCVP